MFKYNRHFETCHAWNISTLATLMKKFSNECILAKKKIQKWGIKMVVADDNLTWIEL